MQELSTGLIRQIDDLSQEAKDRAIPNRENQGSTFTVGEIIIVKSGRFKVHAITEKRLYLDSLPSA